MIDWDDVLEDADATPRSVLAEWLGRVEEIELCIVVVLYKEEDGHLGSRVNYTANSAGDVVSLGMLETAKGLILKRLELD